MRKPRERTKYVNGKRYHIYRVRVEQRRVQHVFVEAENPGQAEGMALDVARRREHMYRECDPEATAQTVEMTDGSVKPLEGRRR